MAPDHRARSVLIHPNLSSQRFFSPPLLSEEISQQMVSQQGGGFCPQSLSISQFLRELAGWNHHRGNKKRHSRTALVRGASAHLERMMIQKELRAGQYSGDLHDIDLVCRLIELISGSEAFFRYHCDRPAPSNSPSNFPLSSALPMALTSEVSGKSFVAELTRLMSHLDHHLALWGYQSSYQIMAQLLWDLGDHLQKNPHHLKDYLSSFHQVFVGGFVTANYLEYWLIEEIATCPNAMCFSRSPETKHLASSVANSAYPLIPQPMEGCSFSKNPAPAGEADIKRAIVGFSSKASQVKTLLELAHELGLSGVPSNKTGLFVGAKSGYETLLSSYAKLLSPGSLSFRLSQQLSSSVAGSFIKSVLRYLDSPRSAWNFYHLITEPALEPWFLASLTSNYLKQTAETEASWAAQMTEDLACIKDYLSYFVSKTDLSLTTSQIIDEYSSERAKNTFIAKKSIERLLGRTPITPKDMEHLGKHTFYLCHKLLAGLLTEELPPQHHDKWLTATISKVFGYFDLLTTDRGLLDELEICYGEILITLAGEDQLKRYDSLTKVLAFVLSEMKQRHHKTHYQKDGWRVMPLSSVSHNFQVAITFGVQDPFTRSPDHKVQKWLQQKSKATASSCSEPNHEAQHLRELWHRVPIQIYGYLRDDHHDQVPPVFADVADKTSKKQPAYFCEQTLHKLRQYLGCSPPTVKAIKRERAVSEDSSKDSTEISHDPLVGKVDKIDPTIFNTISPSSWDRLLTCPYQFYLAHKRLHSLPLPDSHGFIERGAWLHKLMECFFTGLETPEDHAALPYLKQGTANTIPRLTAESATNPGELRRRLELIGCALLPPISFIQPDEWHQIRYECLPFIAQMFAHIFKLYGWPISIMTEHMLDQADYQTSLFPDTPHATTLTGRIDLYLKFAGGEGLVIDYKAKTLPSLKKVQESEDSQLLLYSHALKPADPGLAYWALEKNEFQWVYQPEHLRWQDMEGYEAKKTYITSRNELDQLTAKCFSRYQQARSDIMHSQQFAITPSEAACQYCHYSQICRKDDPILLPPDPTTDLFLKQQRDHHTPPQRCRS